MPHQNEKNTPSYKGLSTQALDAMIHDMMLSEKELDMEQVDAILRELNSREEVPGGMAPEEAWKVFQKKYSGKESAYID